jgi:2-methylcitrate dehydratase
VLEATLELKRKHGLSSSDVEHVQCDIFQSGYDIAGGGSFGSKHKPTTKEQADYNLKYLIAAALLDDQVGPAQLEPNRVQAADAQALLARVEVLPDAEFSARYPQEMNARITVHTKDGRALKQEKLGYEGSLANPLSWERVVEKFHWLSEAHADAELRGRIIEVVQTLDERPLSDLMSLLAAVRPVVTYATAHPGIQ